MERGHLAAYIRGYLRHYSSLAKTHAVVWLSGVSEESLGGRFPFV